MNMLQNIKNKIFLRYCKASCNHTAEGKSFVNFQKARSVLIFFESDPDEINTEIKNIIKDLKDSGKNVMAIGLVDKKIIESPELYDFQLFNFKNFDWKGKPNAGLISLIQKSEYDWVIDLSVRPILPIQYMLMISKSRFRIGLKKEIAAPLDFMIDISNFETAVEGQHTMPNINYLYNQIIFYLKNIQTSD